MHLVFGIVLIVLVMMLAWETLILIGLLLRLACYLIALPFLLVWLLITVGIELHRYLKRQQLASAIGLDAVTVALQPELAVTLTRNRNGVWE